MNPARAKADAEFAVAEAKLKRLQSLDPLLIDVSLREPCFSSYYGHILQNKIDLLKLVDQFGIKNKIIATLDFAYPEHPEVENEFCIYLNKIGYDLTGCFAATAVGTMAHGRFVPDKSMLNLVEYNIPNTLHEIYLTGSDSRDHLQILERIANSVAWLRQHVKGDHGGPCRIYLNVPDLPDALYDPANREFACQVLGELAAIDVDGVSFEDARGTYFPFQIGAVVRAMKALLKPAQKVLFHAHAGNGMENASVLEALLEGADGYWAGMEKESSTIGHASMGELIGNLMRAGNPHMAANYQVGSLLPICHQMHRINNVSEAPQTWPIQGSNAYRQMYSGFDQTALRFMDLPPDAIGNPYTFRISPAGSDEPVIQGRAHEVLGFHIGRATATRMILLMRQDLLAGIRIRYNDPDQLRKLYERALVPHGHAA